MNWLFNSLGGRKFTLGLVAIGSVLALCLTGNISGEEALNAIKWVVISVVGAIAVEDGLGKLKQGDTTQ